VNSLPKVDFQSGSTVNKEVKMYPFKEDDEQINMAAEPEA